MLPASEKTAATAADALVVAPVVTEEVDKLRHGRPHQRESFGTVLARDSVTIWRQVRTVS